MAQTTYANSRGIVHKGSNGGVNIVFPDVCKTPRPGGPVPIPYPNIGKSSDTSKGPKSVKTDRQLPMVKGAQYTRNMGDEAGTLKWIISSDQPARLLSQTRTINQSLMRFIRKCAMQASMMLISIFVISVIRNWGRDRSQTWRRVNQL